MKILPVAIAVLIVAIVSAPGGVAARTETGRAVGAGSTIRFRTEATGDLRITGKVLSVDAETLLLGDTWVSGTRYDRASLTDVQVKAGTHGHAGQGLAAGALCGALLGVALFSSDEFLDIGAGTAALGGALLGAPLGAAVGAAIRHDQWSPVAPGDFRVGLGCNREHGAALSVSARL